MAQQEAEFLGVSPPLSTEMPKPRDTELYESLMAELKAQNNFEAPEQTQKRAEVLGTLNKLLIQLVQKVGKKKGLNPELLKEAGGKISTYGSYRLGVYGPGSDIDTLMLSPKHVTREDFFEHMPDMIRQEIPPERLTELVPVAGISVPIIKTEIDGISIDLIWCTLQKDKVPKSLQLDDTELLRGLSETDLKCMNGTRVTDRILSLVPQTRTFRIALRAVKIWAQKRGLYGNVYGYPGGVAYAMMVARVCQLYPKAAASAIVAKFFWVVKNWKWPSPIYLQAREKGPSLNQQEWDPNKNFRDKRHLMPVITPAYPVMNATHTITRSTKTVLLRELERGHQIMSDIYAGKQLWRDLFVKHQFFTSAYQHYIVVVTASKTKEEQQAWSGLVSSRVRFKLVEGIEDSADKVKLVQPFNKGVERHHKCKTQKEIESVLGGGLEGLVDKATTTEETADVKQQAAAGGDADVINELATTNGDAEGKKDGELELWTTTFYLGIELNTGEKQLDISYSVNEFKNNVQSWPGYNPDVHSVQIKYHRSTQLPLDLFGEGETRPVKKKKAKNENLEKKRSFTNAGLDENQNPAKRRHSASVNGNGTPTTNGTTG
ncbi:Putative polymerase, nucleotidyl transferase domain, poly(A) polymerase, RNA-binding protein [Septoria linicola]|uniref:Poly(A) polymerase n=1 Tax=Septoria linicola TaxID=215465 RepID=A0A9Q9AT30_9PEZI|nr:putative polymerase, nucleotidyl transferase domain, poly(A) polymerase, RNA-binding protein [Septoria linicola]USW50246.1 Putative polymerase, nucleotidyl transferase domain, poly(A) polymerase, RNA-binding protein [Septoria linicola]